MIHRNDQGEIEFRFHDPQAQEVYLVGDFNCWDTEATPMSRTAEGHWFVRLTLEDGVYEYKFLADGRYRLDDAASGVEEVPFACNSVLVLNQRSEPALPVG
ncbi:MAG TPA: isoamylase early set domain-containing protein [Phycisphaerae bacterium]|nr:isoamylase early set domain-containing protein [Phycisphaerae bacterium]HOJ72726.1 isoamylase early set domain-containing protein [Phycisphaerae bacterium]HOM53509.1 isoamylase early set domain-containing protein [Phycisphaerae bacterium]HON65790.1 isoamylase early set domain-containing protein [Phycisphaerae bacterium]HOQ84425.1 isoamylase early set domain-containing protein [Phycisphaerae bacterium]